MTTPSRQANTPMDRTPPGSFEPMYATEGDPWSFATSWYEQRRYRLIDALLPAERYRRCFEPGASIGELTRLLARRCDRVETLDPSLTAARTSRSALAEAGHDHVAVRVGALPEHQPSGPFDLVVLSEIAYYFDATSLARVLAAMEQSFDREVTVVACHWLGSSLDHRLSGDEVHAIMHDRWGPARCSLRDHGFRCDVWITA